MCDIEDALREYEKMRNARRRKEIEHQLDTSTFTVSEMNELLETFPEWEEIEAHLTRIEARHTELEHERLYRTQEVRHSISHALTVATYILVALCTAFLVGTILIYAWGGLQH